jgi:tetratricopeptide (TPR) repeat protein/peroxiredoxin
MRIGKGTGLLFLLLAGIIVTARECPAKLASNQTAPVFSCKDLHDRSHDLSQVKDRPMVILYFFDTESKSSREGLLSLQQLSKQHPEADLVVWAITLADKEQTARFAASNGVSFPVLLDKTGVSTTYEAQVVLPTMCILGPGLKVLDHIQGGGKSAEMMLVRLAERELQRKQTGIAVSLSDQVIMKDPQNVEAKVVKAHAELKRGKVNEAGQIFQELAQKGGPGEIPGKEGLAAVHAKKGETDKALKLVSEVEQKAPERAYPHVIRGDLLYSQNKVLEAQSEFQKAVGKKQAEPYLHSAGPNQLGRLYAKKGQGEEARKLYDQAVAIDPYYIEGTTNKGLTYERERKWDKALESYRQALAVEKNDVFAAVLAKKAQEMLDLQKDAKRKERMDRLVKELAERYRTQKKTAAKDADEWTSRPLILTFLDFQEKGGLTERDGFASVLALQLTDHLNASNRVQVVERVLLERLLEELNLGSSELADPETALRLGRVLAAKLIATGSLAYLPNGTLMSLRLIDTETSSIPLVINRDLGPQTSVENALFQLNREILQSVIGKYPIRGYVVKSTGDRLLLNVGSKQGVVQGSKFEVLQEQEAVQYKGKTLHAGARPFAQLEVVQVEPELCYARVLEQERSPKTDDKVQEKL